MVIKVGMLGFNEGNGHPFSFSAILNGYNREEFEKTEWKVILAYLERQPKESIGFPEVEVTHAWTPFPAVTQRLCQACNIACSVENPQDMLGHVDAVIIATDNYAEHFSLARIFLEQGYPVFIDKPLTMKESELDYFVPFIEAGQLMSTSGLRYAIELDVVRENLAQLGVLKLINGVVLNDFKKYGIHLLDAISGLGIGSPVMLSRLPTAYESFLIKLSNGTEFSIAALGPVVKTFHLGFYGTKGTYQVDLFDNFSAFRRTLKAFIAMVKTKIPPIAALEIDRTIRLLIKANTLAVGQSLELCEYAS